MSRGLPELSSDTAGGASALPTGSTNLRSLVSADGRWSVFVSSAPNLAPGQVDANSGTDVFLYDRVNDTVTLVSHASGALATTANGVSLTPSISADGRWITFGSEATNLVQGQLDTNAARDVFLYDRDTGAINLISRSAAVATFAANNISSEPLISADGSSVVYLSRATNLVMAHTDQNSADDVFFWSRATGINTMVSHIAGLPSSASFGSVASEPVISADGEWVAFTSTSASLVTGGTDTNLVSDVFLWNRTTNTNQLVSHAHTSALTSGSGSASSPRLSADGGTVLFRGIANNYVSGFVDGNNGVDLFLFSRATGAITLVSHTATSPTTTGSSSVQEAALSADGNWVALISESTNYVAGQVDNNFNPDVFLFNRANGTLSLVSRRAGTTATTANNSGFSPWSLQVSDDGSFVVFQSAGSDLISGQSDTNPGHDLFVFDRLAGTAALLSGAAASATATGNDVVQTAGMTGDGRWFLFTGLGTNYVAGIDDFNGTADVFLADRVGRTTALVSRRDANLPSASAGGDSAVLDVVPSLVPTPAVSGDGRYTVFQSTARNLVPGLVDGNGDLDIFLHDQSTGEIVLVSRANGSTTTAGNAASRAPVISTDGRWVAFVSRATNLIAGQSDSSGTDDVFLWDRTTGNMTLVSRSRLNPATAVGGSTSPLLTADGAHVAFISTANASSLVTGAFDSSLTSPDAYSYARDTGVMTLVSHISSSLFDTDGGITRIFLSSDGRFVGMVSTLSWMFANANDTPGTPDLFQWDRTTGAIVLASHSATALNAAIGVTAPAMSADGNFMVFSTRSTTVVSGVSDTNGAADLYLWTRSSNLNRLVSRSGSSAATAGNGAAEGAAISADGRYVAYLSRASNMIVSGSDANISTDVFLYDRTALTNRLVSHTPASVLAASNGAAQMVAISSDGSRVAFVSTSTNLISGQTDVTGTQDLFLYDVATTQVTLASHRASSATAGLALGCDGGALSTNGRVAVFQSTDSSLASNDFNGRQDVFLWTDQTGTDLAIAKTNGISSVVPGQTVTYLITATNSGPQAASATVTDSFPAALQGITWTCAAGGGASCGAASGAGSLSQLVNLPVNGTVTFTVTATVAANATGTLSNTASITPGGGVTDTNPANNSATDTDTLIAQANLLILVNDAPDPVGRGATLTYTILMANEGPGTATNVTVTDTLPAGATFLSASGSGWTCGHTGGVVTCTRPSQAPSPAVPSITIQVAAPVAVLSTLTNTVSISSATPDPVTSNNTASAVTSVSQPSILVGPAAARTTTEAGGTAFFSVVLGSAPLAPVTVSFVSSNMEEGTVSPGSVTFTSANWSSAQSVTINGIDDAYDDGDIAYTILTSVSSADPGYAGIDPADVPVTNLDDEISGFSLTANPMGVITTEAGGTTVFTIAPTSQPRADVTVSFTSSNTAEGTVSPASVTFTPGDWNQPRSITITGVDDDYDDGDVEYTVTLNAAVSADPGYAGIDPPDANVTNQDDDTAGVTVAPVEGLVAAEAGGTATFTVVLNARPRADVTFPLTSSYPDEGTVEPAVLTFTTDNWNTPQTVTITGTDDDYDDGDAPLKVLTGVTVSMDPAFRDIDPADVSYTIQDDDTAGVTFAPAEGLTTTEAGGTATFTMVLTARPRADVIFSLTSSNTDEGTVDLASPTFTSDNWNMPQTVTVTGVDDLYDDNDATYTVTPSVTFSMDPVYREITLPNVSVTNQDDDTAGFAVTPAEGLTTTEAGGMATFTVALTSRPRGDVTAAFTSKDAAEGLASPAIAVFTAEDWNQPRTVTLTGVDDSYADGDVEYIVDLRVMASVDAQYAGIDPADLTVTNQDNDSAGITVTPTEGLTTTEEGGTATFTVVLNARPRADVTIPLASSDDEEGTVEPELLIFTTDTWNVPQTVTVTGADDDYDDGDVESTITTGAAVSTDAAWAGVDAADATFTNEDDDTAGIEVTPTEGLITTEGGGTATFTVVLKAQPTGDVTIALESSDAGEGEPSPATLTFTTDNWATPQTVTVTGQDDDSKDGDVAYTITLHPAQSGDAAFAGLDPADVTATNRDDNYEGVFYTVTPCRLADTRQPGYGPALQNNQVAIVEVHGACGIPPTAKAVAMNLTFTGAGQPGTVLVYPGDLTQPPVDEYLWIRAGNVSLSLSTLMKLGEDGTLAIHPKLKAPRLNPTVHIVLDVTGYFE